jgi:hypothetical protein
MKYLGVIGIVLALPVCGRAVLIEEPVPVPNITVTASSTFDPVAFVGKATEKAELIPQNAPVSGPTLDIKKDCGAKGDGVNNDTDAFRKAAERIQKAGGGKLVLPKGVYLVGDQYHEQGQYPYYKHKSIFQLTKVNGVTIEGRPGAIIRMRNGMRFGSFDKDTGEPYDPIKEKTFANGLFADPRYAVFPGDMIEINDSQNVVLRDIELDGNSGKWILGGMYGDTGRQLPASGLKLYGNSNVLVKNLFTHHHGLDGIIVGYPHMKENNAPAPHVLVNITSEYNARQGLSWVGGRGLKVIDSKFNHTGRGAFQSAPAAGLDIEAEDSICRDGMFVRCEFVNNSGCGVVAESGDGGYTTFTNCTMWGTTTWALWNSKPCMKFESCRFYGSIVHAYGSVNAPATATQYIRCHFEDKEHLKHGVYRSDTLITHDGNAANVRFVHCEVVANKTKGVWLAGGALLSHCQITHRNTQLADHDFQSLFRGGNIDNTRFVEDFPRNFTNSYHIVAEGVTIGTNVRVQGPCVKWGHWTSGKTGVLEKK